MLFTILQRETETENERKPVTAKEAEKKNLETKECASLFFCAFLFLRHLRTCACSVIQQKIVGVFLSTASVCFCVGLVLHLQGEQGQGDHGFVFGSIGGHRSDMYCRDICEG